MNFLDFLGDSIMRIRQYAEDNRKEKNTEYVDGIDMGIYIALSVLHNDAQIYAETFEDKGLLRKLNLDFDVEKEFTPRKRLSK